MKKIKSHFNQKDRVICVTNQGHHEFYYQPVGSKERTLLFRTEEFSGSVWDYFRSRGRNMEGRGFSLSIRELYEFKRFHNKKLTSVMDRIPVMIDHVLSEQLKQKEAEKGNITVNRKTTHNRRCEEHEAA